MNKKLKKWLIWLFALFALLLISIFFSLSVGADRISLAKVVALIFNPQPGTESAILFQIRLPRILLAIFVGGTLAVAGVIFQGMFRNPLVGPYTLGVSGGAGLGVTLTIILGLHFIAPLAGMLGAILAIIVVYFLASRRGFLRVSILLLIGVMVSFFSSSLITLIMALANVTELHGIFFWIMGSLEESNILLIKLVVTLSTLGAILSFFFAHTLNAFSLGEEEALHLGINVERTKKLLFVLASLLTGAVVSVSGMIGFVGLVVPHFMRLLVGADHHILLPSAFLGGGIFLLLCDTFARTIISPMELPVGVITGILGGIIFICLLSRKGSGLNI